MRTLLAVFGVFCEHCLAVCPLPLRKRKKGFAPTALFQCLHTALFTAFGFHPPLTLQLSLSQAGLQENIK